VNLSKAKESFLYTSQITCIVTTLYAYQSPNTQWHLIAFIYFACFFTYNFERVYQQSPEDKINHPLRRLFLQKHQSLIRFTCFISILICFYLALFLTKFQLLILVLASIPTALYLSPKLYFCKKRLKEIFLAKEFSIAFAWALTVAVLPHAHFDLQLFILSFCLALINIMACDQLDQKGDSKYKIKTLANVSKQSSTFISVICLVFILCSLYFKVFAFALAFTHILLCKNIKASSLQYDLALIWPALISL
jgi:hypothetical protein